MENYTYQFDNLFNVRDLGGYLTKDNRQTLKNRYIRGSAKGTLTMEEKELLYNNGVRAIIDLRDSKETNKVASPLKGYRDIKYYHIDMIGEFYQAWEMGFKDLGALYVFLLDNAKEQLYSVFKIFLTHLNEGVYFHCTAGKDRTGIISSLLLGLVGVSDQDIINNYKVSYQNNLKRPSYKTLTPEMKQYVYSYPHYMNKMLKHLYKKYHSFAEYLINIGLKKEELQKIKDNFLE